MEIRRLPLPGACGTPESAPFEELVGVLNGIVRDLWGDDDFVETPEEALASLSAQEYVEKVVLVAEEDGAIAGRVQADLPLDEGAETASLLVDVAPGLRGRGIGTALLAAGEDLAAGRGRRVVSVFTEHPVAALPAEGPWVHAPAGATGLPRADPAVRFALRHGYRLGQIERSSELLLPLPAVREAALASTASTVHGYRVVSWFGAAPDALVDAFAALKARMSTDVPQAALAVDRERWTAARVRALEEELARRGEPLLVTAAQHLATGELAAYTELTVPVAGEKAEQYDTLVAHHHRGHRLGTLVKLHNLHELQRRAPRVRRVITWNADENDPMLAINRAFGFRPHALTGTWQKEL